MEPPKKNKAKSIAAALMTPTKKKAALQGNQNDFEPAKKIFKIEHQEIETPDQLKEGYTVNSLLEEDDETMTLISTQPKPETFYSQFPELKKKQKSFSETIFKQKVLESWKYFISKNDPLQRTEKKPFSPLQSKLLNWFTSQTDVFYSQRNFDNAQEIREALCLHILNYVLARNDKIKESNALFAEMRKERKSFHTVERKDQGFTRPAVLVLLPFKHAALLFVSTLILVSKKIFKEIGNMKRFEEEYSWTDDQWLKNRFQEYNLFFEGNIDDSFRFGISFSGRTIKLNSQFYQSDILIASPLGLSLAWNSRYEPENDFDFLSSIEILVCDQLDVFQMQNWDRLLEVFQHLNQIPKKSRDTDFSRVKDYFLDGHGDIHRQTILISATSTPEMNALFNRKCHNFRGKSRIKSANTEGVISELSKKIKQIWMLIEAPTLEGLIDARRHHFLQSVLPKLLEIEQKGVLVYIPSWLEFTQVEKHFRDQILSYSQAHEYMLGKKDKTSLHKELKNFQSGETHFLLMSERLHFNTRFKLKGVEMVVFYGLPRYPQFYPELFSLVSTKSQAESYVFFSALERPQIEPIIGVERTREVLKKEKKTFLFY